MCADLLNFNQNCTHMKTLLLLFFAFLFGVHFAKAQVYVGPVAGGQLSWTKFDNRDFYNTYGIKPVWGWHAGASFSMKVRNRFFLHSSLLYSTKGRTVEGKDDPLLKNKVRYNFIEAPIIYAVDFKGRMGKGKEFKFYIGVGPNVSYWLGGKGKLYNSDLAENNEFVSQNLEYSIVFRKDLPEVQNDEMNVAEPNRIQLGLNLASGMVLEPRPDRKLLIMLRYELGHSFLSRTSNGTFVPTYYQDVLQSRNKGFRLSVSYQIDLRVEDRKRGKSTIKQKKL